MLNNLKFEIKGKEFYCNNQPFKIISGAVHYFRNIPSVWKDIFKKMRAMGCNCVETYCAWNMHEKKPNKFCFEGMLDVAEFVRSAAEENLMVIIRPGPYICAEWEFGGLPWWIQKDNDRLEIRCCNLKYMKYVERYLQHLLDQLRPLFFTNGGPIIMLQCENEYGYYGDDKIYLKRLYDLYRHLGVDIPIFTSDGTSVGELLDGNIEGCLSTLNFGSHVEDNLKVHDQLFPDSPKMCMELWCGWFDAWGDKKHHTTSVKSYAQMVDEMLGHGSLNIYMFIGGTNFGFTSGANYYDKFSPDVTSYDYDALLTENGDITKKYLAVRKVVSKYQNQPLPPIPPNRKKKAYGEVFLDKSAALLDNLNYLSKPIFSNVPKCMEFYNCGYGYIVYQTKLNRNYLDTVLSFESIGDRAHIYVNKKLVGIVYINDEKLEIHFSASAGDILTILCENMGRVNFGPKMNRKKGIVGKCLLDGKTHFNWNVYPLQMENLKKLKFSNNYFKEISCFYKGNFIVDECADTFLSLNNFSKGFVLINGFNIGRHWKIGPQKTLYIPAGLLHSGKNEIIVFDSDGLEGDSKVVFTNTPKLN